MFIHKTLGFQSTWIFHNELIHPKPILHIQYTPVESLQPRQRKGLETWLPGDKYVACGRKARYREMDYRHRNVVPI